MPKTYRGHSETAENGHAETIVQVGSTVKDGRFYENFVLFMQIDPLLRYMLNWELASVEAQPWLSLKAALLRHPSIQKSCRSHLSTR